MKSIHLDPQQRHELQRRRHQTHDRRLYERLSAVLWVADGKTRFEVADLLGRSVRQVAEWLRLLRNCGLDALCTLHYHGDPGSGRTLSDEQVASLQQTIDGHRPEEVGIAVPLWTRRALCELIRQEYGIHMPVRTVGAYLRRWGYTAQRPTFQDMRRDDDAIKWWVRRRFPRALKEAARRGAYVVFIDEAGFMMQPLVRRAYARRGHTPVQRVADKHGRISAIGAIVVSPRRDSIKLHYGLLANNANFRGPTVAESLRTLHAGLAAPMTVFWDQIPIHDCAAVDEYLTAEPEVVIEPLPPYAPDLNPADGIWRYTKYSRLANYCPPDLSVLRRKVTSELDRLQGQPALLKSFVRYTRLPLDL